MLNSRHNWRKTRSFVFHVYGKNTIIVIFRVHGYACMLASLYYFDKTSQYTFSKYLSFQSMNSNTKVGFQKCLTLIKKTLVRRQSIVVVRFVRFWTNFTPCLSAFMAVFEKQVNVQCGIGSISMLISSHIHNAANRTIANNSW